MTDWAYDREARTNVAGIVMTLQTDLGQRLVAYVTGMRCCLTIGRWAEGDDAPSAVAEERLRALYRTCLILRGEHEDRWGAATIRAWLTSKNPNLGDDVPLKTVPLEILRSGDPVRVEHAAVDFAEC